VELKRNLPQGEVEIAIDTALTKLVGSLNLKWNLNENQIKQIVEDLVFKYPNETVEDFILVFRRARQNEFGEIYRLDSAVIFGWMEYYLEEKYTVVEQQLKAEKEEYYKPPEKVEDVDRLKQWKASIDAITIGKTILPMTEQEAKEEGQVRPPKKAYTPPPLSYVEQHEKHMRYLKANYDTYTGKPLKDIWVKEETWNALND